MAVRMRTVNWRSRKRTVRSTNGPPHSAPCASAVQIASTIWVAGIARDRLEKSSIGIEVLWIKQVKLADQRPVRLGSPAGITRIRKLVVLPRKGTFRSAVNVDRLSVPGDLARQCRGGKRSGGKDAEQEPAGSFVQVIHLTYSIVTAQHASDPEFRHKPAGSKGPLADETPIIRR